MDKIYSKEILEILENIAKAIASHETQEIRLFKNGRGRYVMTKTENIPIAFGN